MEEYVGFVDEIGRTTDGKYIYRFDFTFDEETIWGEFFNVTPAGIIPNLMPDINSLSKSVKVVFPRQMEIAKKNYCFSMQDCIDGIIPLIFSEIDEYTLEYEGKPFFIRFGETFEEVSKKIEETGLEILEIEEVHKGDDSAIDKLLNLPDENPNSYGTDDDFDENFDDLNLK